MELREIETFLAIIDCGTFSKAAEKLGYSQSAVTTQVKQLEHDLGARLFDRVPRGAVLTDQGRAFAFHAQELMGAARAARASVAADPLDSHDMTGTLRIGAVESIATAILPDLLIRYHEVCPHVQAVVVSAPRDLMVEGLRNNTLDLLLTMERHLHLPGLVTHALRPEPVVFAAAPQLLAACNVAADAGDPLGAEQLVQLPFVLTEHGESYRLELDRALDALDLQVDEAVVNQDVRAGLNLVGEVKVIQRDVLGRAEILLGGGLGGHDDGVAGLDGDLLVAFEQAGADLGALGVEQDADGQIELGGDAADALDAAVVLLVGAVGEIETGDVHARLHHLAQDVVAVAGGTHGAYNFRALVHSDLHLTWLIALYNREVL